jgi:hypothetical protein
MSLSQTIRLPIAVIVYAAKKLGKTRAAVRHSRFFRQKRKRVKPRSCKSQKAGAKDRMLLGYARASADSEGKGLTSQTARPFRRTLYDIYRWL